MVGATINTGTGILTLAGGPFGGVRVEPSTVSSVINGNIDVWLYTPEFLVFPGAAADGLIVNANIRGRFATDEMGNPVYSGINKLGEGRMVLNGNSTFDGRVRILEGTLVAGSAGAFGSTNGGVEVYWASSLGLNGAHIGNERLTVNATNVGLFGNLVSSWSGPVILNSNTTFQSSGTLTFSNVISGAAGLRLEGATFDFAGTEANTYAGLTVRPRDR
jgi:autotransporter-associated beta strand protein